MKARDTGVSYRVVVVVVVGGGDDGVNKAERGYHRVVITKTTSFKTRDLRKTGKHNAHVVAG